MTMTYTELFAVLVADLEITIRRRKNDASIRFAYDGAEYDVGDRTERMTLIQLIADEYVKAHADVNQRTIDAWEERGGNGERPVSLTLNTALLDRLSNAVLDEELTDPTGWKSRHTEYPFLSELQMARRTDGNHQRKYEGDSGEAKLSAAQNYGTDGRSYNVPLRRERSKNENIFMDTGIKTRNKERKATYEAFTGEQPVHTRMMTPEEREAYGCQLV